MKRMQFDRAKREVLRSGSKNQLPTYKPRNEQLTATHRRESKQKLNKNLAKVSVLQYSSYTQDVHALTEVLFYSALLSSELKILSPVLDTNSPEGSKPTEVQVRPLEDMSYSDFFPR